MVIRATEVVPKSLAFFETEITAVISVSIERKPMRHAVAHPCSGVQEWRRVITNLIEDLKSIPTRTRNALIKDGIRTVAQLEELTDAELGLIPEVGKKGLREIKEAVLGPVPNLTLREQRQMLESWRGRKPT